MSTNIQNNTSAATSARTKATPASAPELAPKAATFAACVANQELLQVKTLAAEVSRFTNTTVFTNSGESIDLVALIEKVQGNGQYLEEEHYLVESSIQPELLEVIQPVRYHQSQSTSGEHRIIPEKLPRFDGFTCGWFESMALAMVAANQKWIVMRPNRETEQYEYSAGRTHKPIPTEWPNFSEQLAEAFEGRIIDSLDHPVLKRLGLAPNVEEWDSDDAL